MPLYDGGHTLAIVPQLVGDETTSMHCPPLATASSLQIRVHALSPEQRKTPFAVVPHTFGPQVGWLGRHVPPPARMKPGWQPTVRSKRASALLSPSSVGERRGQGRTGAEVSDLVAVHEPVRRDVARRGDGLEADAVCSRSESQRAHTPCDAPERSVTHRCHSDSA